MKPAANRKRASFFFLLSSASRALTRGRSGQTGAGDSAGTPGGGIGSFGFVTSGLHLTFLSCYGFIEELYQRGKTMQKNSSGLFC